MLFNPICISNKKNLIVGDYYIQNTPIRSVSNVKYLGVTSDERLSFNEHINRISHNVRHFYRGISSLAHQKLRTIAIR